MPGTAQNIEDTLRSVRDDLNAALGRIDPAVFDFRRFPFSFMGKAARARFTILAGDALLLGRDRSARLASAAELTHTASLLHDDCIDRALYRRGLPTLNEKLGVNTAILVGDLIVSLALDFAASASQDLVQELVLAIRHMTEGALLEENAKGRKISAAEADRIVELKTGALFRWCALAACRLAGRPELLETCGRIGKDAGTAFQMIDDVLDFEGDAGACGKETLKDIKEGKFTLPLILALNDAAAGPKAEKLLSRMKTGPEADLSAAVELAGLVSSGGFSAQARRKASEKIKELFPLIDRLPGTEGAAALKTFLLTLGERTA
ncbi:MAG TPA: hypothetical protein DCZ92_05960 [Elusimicrobia bacterium]|nr:MAG: hypothetical protein A2016_07155 [Elusimicrobia bacterium GWF2_62_30]HBA60349.1 hypothetical protein [Elusimicrobiota bacterium]